MGCGSSYCFLGGWWVLRAFFANLIKINLFIYFSALLSFGQRELCVNSDSLCQNKEESKLIRYYLGRVACCRPIHKSSLSRSAARSPAVRTVNTGERNMGKKEALTSSEQSLREKFAQLRKKKQVSNPSWLARLARPDKFQSLYFAGAAN